MASSRRKCLNSPDSFCYICGSFAAPSQRKDISDFVKRAYLAYFKVTLDKEGDCFQYICSAFPGLSYEKVKAGVFDGPHIRQLIKDQNFTTSMTAVEKRACKPLFLL